MSRCSTGLGKIGAMRLAQQNSQLDDSEQPLNAEQAAAFLGLAVVSFWRQVSLGMLHKPYYPAPAAPRWLKGELRSAREELRMLPREAKARRFASRTSTDTTT
jgi:hypothetical protein